MEGIQQIAQDIPRLWDVTLYLIWPAILGAYGIAWKFYLLAREDIKELRSEMKTALDNDLKHLEARIEGLEERLKG